MKFIKILLISLSAFLFCHNALALGKVSRSCLAAGAQESITVDWRFNPYWLWTASSHYRNGVILHTINTTRGGVTSGWDYTWRSYAGHLGTEFWYGTVIGYHYSSYQGFITSLGTTTASNCNLSQWGG